MNRNAEQKVIDYLTILIMQDSKFICNHHIRAKCAWIEAKKIYKKINKEKRNKLLKLAESKNYTEGEKHLPNFWD